MSQPTIKIHNTLHSDHSEIDLLLKELFAALSSGDARRSFKKLDLFWARLAMHIRAEHLHLFPAVLKAFQNPVRSLETSAAADDNDRMLYEKLSEIVEQLREDHDFFMRELAAAVKQMRELRGKDAAEQTGVLCDVNEKVSILSRRLERHNELEETAIYQLADALLDATGRARLNALIQKELDNLPPRFGDGDQL